MSLPVLGTAPGLVLDATWLCVAVGGLAKLDRADDGDEGEGGEGWAGHGRLGRVLALPQRSPTGGLSSSATSAAI